MVIASIDMMQGKVVQLKQGREKVLERDDAVALAKEFDRYGEIAVIDLDAAMGKGENKQLIRDILQYGEFRVGGGIRTVERAKELAALGAKKVIIGSQAFEQNEIHHTFLQELVESVGQAQIIIAVDSLERKIVTRGWKHQTDIPLLDAITELEPYASEFLFTCVEREGTMQGADFAQIHDVRQATDRQITVAGGIATLEEVVKAARLGVDVQLGMALYTGKITLAEAFVECLNWDQTDPMPTMIQDEQGQMLMDASSTRETLRQAFETGIIHEQKVMRMRLDREQGAVLVTVER